MAKESFIMLSLEEDKAKDLTTVLSNDKCRKIINYLTENDSVTESKVSEDLDIPLSTVHYNIQQLVKNNLVISEEFHYSKKGKEVQHYSLANKYIIISPKPVYGIKQKLRNILPVALIISATAAIIRLAAPIFQKAGDMATFAAPMTKSIADQATMEAGMAAIEEAEMDAAPVIAENAIREAQTLQQSACTIPPPAHDFTTYILWFLAGALLTIITYFAVDWYRNRKK